MFWEKQYTNDDYIQDVEEIKILKKFLLGDHYGSDRDRYIELKRRMALYKNKRVEK